jgi:hypothetical protein
MASAPKPSLHEIAAMPYPASLLAMREHYNHQWGRFDNEAELQTWKCRIHYSYRTEDVFECEVEAATEDEAEKLAEDAFDRASDVPSHSEIDDVCAQVSK